MVGEVVSVVPLPNLVWQGSGVSAPQGSLPCGEGDIQRDKPKVSAIQDFDCKI